MPAATKNILRKVKSIGFGIIAGIIICELVLRIYNPSPSAIRNGKLLLPANQKKIFTNNWINKLDKKIHYSRNSLGFRGPELPSGTADLLSIITVGGSTTECKFLSDSCTWPSRLYEKLHHENPAVWLNNAGIDGHTTFGHILMIKEYVLKIKPRYILLMTGVNDVELDQPDEFDRMNEMKINTSSVKLFLKSLVNHTELGRSFLTYYQLRVSYKKGLIHREINLNELIDNPVPDSIIAKKMDHQTPYLHAYRQRIEQIITTCRQAGITPVLITQPSLYGSYADPVTHLLIGNKWITKDPNGVNCSLMGKILEVYNDVLRSFSQKVPVIDLAMQMPKNSAYFYDFTHVTNAGAEKIADILFSELRKFIFYPDKQNQ
ncbi:MAG TPA: SGNH/GDSL hydrolase family protein [Chitinophagaceae bacterium]|nr:SGNH/GDSL hydrolase family protein [Chitinophagaceae bacterium]